MRINITINDETIMQDIDFAVNDLLEDEEISFNSEDEKREFIQDCFDNIAQKIELYPNYLPTDIYSDVLDLYEICF